MLMAASWLLAIAGACRSEFSRPGNELASSSSDDRAKLIIEDPNWHIESLGDLPVERSPLSMSCTANMSCWLSNSHLMWISADGRSWRQIPVPGATESDAILSMFPFTSQITWLVKTSGLYKTRDGGNNWERVSVPDLDKGKGRIHAAYFQDERVGWVVGGKYRPLRTGEGVVNNALSDDRKSILTGCILRTPDGGDTWHINELPESVGRFDAIMFVNDLGIASGDAGCAVTTDGGKRWNEILRKYRNEETGETPEAHGVFFLDENNGWITLSWAQIIATRNGGKSWELIYRQTDSKPNVGPDTFGDIAFIDRSHGLAITQELGGGRLFKTSDGGKSWTGISANERFRQLALTPATRRGVLLGTKHVYSVSQINRD
jgi:photosystem II stability/assembly factor-like uncharacterized protein